MYRTPSTPEYKVMRASYDDDNSLDTERTSVRLNEAAADGFRLHSTVTDSNKSGLPVAIFVMIKDG